MEHSIALVTGATSGLGHAAARILAREGWREIIVTGRNLALIQETAAQLTAETKRQVFTPLERFPFMLARSLRPRNSLRTRVG